MKKLFLVFGFYVLGSLFASNAHATTPNNQDIYGVCPAQYDAAKCAALGYGPDGRTGNTPGGGGKDDKCLPATSCGTCQLRCLCQYNELVDKCKGRMSCIDGQTVDGEACVGMCTTDYPNCKKFVKIGRDY